MNPTDSGLVPNNAPAHPIKRAIANHFETVKGLLPSNMTAKGLAHSFMLAIAQDQSLANKSPESFGVAFRVAAKLGLEPINGQAYLVPFGGDVVLMPGYRGLINAAKNSGEVLRIEAHIVWQGDEITIKRGSDGSTIEHAPTPDAVPTADNVRGVYAIAFLRDGGTQFEYMSRAQIDHVRNNAASKNSPAWKNHFPEMARAKAVHRLGKFLRLEAEAAEVFHAAERAEAGETIKDADQAFEPAPTQAVEAPAPQGEESDDPLEVEIREINKALGAATTSLELAQVLPRIDKLPREDKETMTIKYQARAKEFAE